MFDRLFAEAASLKDALFTNTTHTIHATVASPAAPVVLDLHLHVLQAAIGLRRLQNALIVNEENTSKNTEKTDLEQVVHLSYDFGLSGPTCKHSNLILLGGAKPTNLLTVTTKFNGQCGAAQRNELKLLSVSRKL